MDTKITFFRGQYRFLSNFFPSLVEYQGKIWPTIEHAYQASKTLDYDLQEEIRLAPTPGKAKRLGRSVVLRSDWNEIRVGIMRDLIKLKFANPHLRERLMGTGLAYLVEGNHWHDNFWGDCHCNSCYLHEGSNMLGTILMRQRDAYLEVGET